MAAFNAERTIQEAIASVLAQTHQNFELVICDDASTDRTVDKILELKESRIHLIRMKENGGPGPARDKCISEALGSWITFLDADDIFLPERLETLLNIAEKYPSDIIADAIWDCHDTIEGLVPWQTVWPPFKEKKQCTSNLLTFDFAEYIAHERTLVKPFISTLLLRKLNASHGHKKSGEDLELLLPFFSNGSFLRYSTHAMYLYRMTAGSLSTSRPERHREYREVFEDALEYFHGQTKALNAINTKINSIHNLEIYAKFVAQVRKKQILEVLKAATKHPWLVVEFTKRIIHRIPFYVHRSIHSGINRTIK